MNDALDETRSALAREQERASQLQVQLNTKSEQLQTLDDERLKQWETSFGKDCFDELPERILAYT